MLLKPTFSHLPLVVAVCTCNACGVAFSDTFEATDDFAGAVYNESGQWRDPPAAIQIDGGATFDIDQASNSGKLTVAYTGGGGATYSIARLDATLDVVGEFVEVTVTNSAPLASGSCARPGIHLQSEVNPGSRSNSLRYGLQGNGQARYHAFDASGDEYADPGAAIPGYVPGDPVTLRVTRTAERTFEFAYGLGGVANTVWDTRDVSVGTALPIIPGLLLDNGTCDWVATFDDFGVGVPGGGGGPGIVAFDDFNDGVWNADGHFERNILQGGVGPDEINFDETTIAGRLLVDYVDSDGADQATLMLRDDVSVPVGGFVAATVAVAGGARNINIRFGIGMASSLGRDARGGQQRQNAFYWGVRQDGVARGHQYGAAGVEIGSTERSLGGYGPGRYYDLAIHRVSANQFDLHVARSGQALDRVGNFTYSGASGPGEETPTIPGIFFDNGLESFAGLMEDFEVGDSWPPPARPVLPNAAPIDPTVPPGEIALVLPSDILDLPTLPTTIHTVNMPEGNGDNTYHHGALIARWQGKFYVAWHSTPASECTEPWIGLVSSSSDGETWSEPFNIGAATGDAEYEAYLRDRFNISGPMTMNAAPRNWHVTDDRLYLWSLAWVQRDPGGRDFVGRIWFTDDGDVWDEIPPQTLDELEIEGLIIRTTGSNRGFAQLDDGRLLAATLGAAVAGGRSAAPTTIDPDGLRGWFGGVIDIGTCPDLGEPVAYVGPDGTLHYTARCSTGRVWHAFSENNGATWSTLTSQSTFTDSPGNKDFGSFPNGWVYYVGNPIVGSRMELVLGISRDGWTFDDNYLIQSESITPIWFSQCKSEDRPGYEYPAATYHDGFMYIPHSRTRDFMQVAKVDVSSIVPSQGPVFIRGDGNGDGIVDIGDPVWNLTYQFLNGSSGGCLDALDTSDDGVIDILDPLLSLFSQFGTGFSIPAPVSCGEDPSEDELGCEGSSGCQ